MRYPTTEGQTYAIVGTADGTITSASGIVIASFTANKQAYFTAPVGGYVTISDANAIVTAVFKLAPGALAGTSDGGDTPIPSGGKNNLTYTFAEDGTYTIQGDLSGMTDGFYMFIYRYKLTSFSVDLSAMTSASYMFYSCEKLTSFDCDLSNLANAESMFFCSGITEWNTPLPALTSGVSTFSSTGLTEWNTPLPNLTIVNNMFSSCEKLTSFSAALPKLTSGFDMFYHCHALTSFSSDLSALTYAEGMFGSTTDSCTKLDLASVQNIAETINNLTAAGKTGHIHIGMQQVIQDTPELEEALAAIRAKGWTVNELYRA